MASTPRNPQPLTESESSIFSKAFEIFNEYSSVISLGSGVASVIGMYISYQQNKEIIKQLREVNRKLDIVIKQLTALSSKLDDIQYQDRSDGLYSNLNEVYLNESTLNAGNIKAQKLADRLRTDLSISATYFLELDPYFAFDFIATVYGELLWLYKIAKVDNKALKSQYKKWFLECLSDKYQTPNRTLGEQKKILKDMESTYVAGTYKTVKKYGRITETITYKVSGDLKNGFVVTTNRTIEDNIPETSGSRGGGGRGIQKLNKFYRSTLDPFSSAQELYAKRSKLVQNLEQSVKRIEKVLLY